MGNCLFLGCAEDIARDPIDDLQPRTVALRRIFINHAGVSAIPRAIYKNFLQVHVAGEWVTESPTPRVLGHASMTVIEVYRKDFQARNARADSARCSPVESLKKRIVETAQT